MNISAISSSMASAASEAGRAVADGLASGKPAPSLSTLQSPAVQMNVNTAVLKKAQEMHKAEIQNLLPK